VSFASRIKELRLKKGVSLQEMADAIGISKAHLWDLESGKSKNPSMELLMKISAYFNVSISSLVGEEPESDAKGEAKAMFRQLNDLNPNARKIIDTLIKQLGEPKSGDPKD